MNVELARVDCIIPAHTAKSSGEKNLVFLTVQQQHFCEHMLVTLRSSHSWIFGAS